MLLFKQLELIFDRQRNCDKPLASAAVVGRALRLPNLARTATGARALQLRRGCDPFLEGAAREILRQLGADLLGEKVRVEWNPRLRTCAGRADFRHSMVSLNPRLQEYGAAEIERTFRHELAHLLAQFRAGRRQIPPHGAQWREACRDLGIADEGRCHNLPFPVQRPTRRYHYRCPHCRREFPRVRRIRRASACLACCRQQNGGKFDARFRLALITAR